MTTTDSFTAIRAAWSAYQNLRAGMDEFKAEFRRNHGAVVASHPEVVAYNQRLADAAAVYNAAVKALGRPLRKCESCGENEALASADCTMSVDGEGPHRFGAMLKGFGGNERY